MKTRRILPIVTVLLAFTFSAQADIIPFDLQGTAGNGLIGGNEHPVVIGGGSGGEIGTGITFDNVTLQLTINIGWGSGNGFTNLTGDATAGHIHGPTTSPAPGSFAEDASPIIFLTSAPFTFVPSATSGYATGTVTLTAPQATDLFDGKLYINIHTSVNPGGEIRGYLIAVPEPSSVLLLALGGLGAARIYLRSRKA